MWRRAILRAFGPMAVFVVCTMVLPHFVRLQNWMFMAAAAVWTIWSVVVVIWDARWRRRFRGVLAAAEGLMCFRCGYDLRGIGPVGACPECGEVFIDTALRERWAAIGFYPRRPERAIGPGESGP
jgi:hypothetical protein